MFFQVTLIRNLTGHVVQSQVIITVFGEYIFELDERKVESVCFMWDVRTVLIIGLKRRIVVDTTGNQSQIV